MQVETLSRRRASARLPSHCRPESRVTPAVVRMQRLLRGLELHSVCEEARCPNLARCFGRATVTFMLLGDVCTRACRFCNVRTGRPEPPDPDEPGRVAEAVAALRLAHVVLTSVNRDDLPDQGSVQFAGAVRAVRERAPQTTLEVLTPDFRGDATCIGRVADARPDVYNHNVETVPRLYRRVRPGAVFRRSVELLEVVKRRHPGMLTKSGLMLGLGEERSEVVQVLCDLRSSGVDAVTLGQYLRPTLRHVPVERYLDPEEFEDLREKAQALGFSHVASGPLVRSSFRADEALGVLRRPEGA